MKHLKEIILANLQINIKNFHFRFEEENQIINNKFFSLGFFYHELIYKPTNELFQDNVFLSARKGDKCYSLLSLNGLAFYQENIKNTIDGY